MGKQEIYVDEGTKELLQQFENSIHDSVVTVFNSPPLDGMIEKLETLGATAKQIAAEVEAVVPAIGKSNEKHAAEIGGLVNSHHDLIKNAFEDMRTSTNNVIVQQRQSHIELESFRDRWDSVSRDIDALRKDLQLVIDNLRYLVGESKNLREWERIPWYRKLFKTRGNSNE
jgi:uncharacterized protein with HEPN domain